MNSVDAAAVSDYLHGIVREGETLKLSQLFRQMESDPDNPAFDYLHRRCKRVSELELFIKDHAYQLIVENGRVARDSDPLETGQQAADDYFEKKLKACKGPVHYLDLMKHVELAPEDVRQFIATFYPETQLRRFFRQRPHLFSISQGGNVCLVDREAVDFFRRFLRDAASVRFMRLRGRVGQAPPQVRQYVNDCYPGTEFLHWLESHEDVFEVDSDGDVRLVQL